MCKFSNNAEIGPGQKKRKSQIWHPNREIPDLVPHQVRLYPEPPCQRRQWQVWDILAGDNKNPDQTNGPDCFGLHRIKSKELDSNSVRNEILQELRRNSYDFESEKQKFDEQITRIYQKQITEIQDFRNRLATVTQTSHNAQDHSRLGRGRPFRSRPTGRRQYRRKPYEH